MISLFRGQRSTIFGLLRTAVSSRLHHKQHKNPAKAECPGKQKPLINLDCKVVLITGGSDGIGLAIAQELLSENARSVALVGICNSRGRESVMSLNNTFGKNKAIFVNCDVQSKVQVAECYSKVMKEYGTIDVVVNAAGVFDEQDWEKEVMTNFVGTIYNTIEAYKIMSKDRNGKGGVILNISGLSGIRHLQPAPILTGIYSGIIGLTRSFGDPVNFKNTGVRVISLCPGCTNTNFIKDADKKTLNEKLGRQLRTLLSKVNRQKADVCAQSAIHMLRYAASGTIWVVNGSKLYSLPIPDWETYRVLESQLL